LNEMDNQETEKSWTLQELADTVQGELEGDGSIRISKVAGIDEAGDGEITFLASPKYHTSLETTRASAVVLSPGIPTAVPAIRSQNPYLAFAKIATLLQIKPEQPAGVSTDLIQGEGCQLGKDLSIHPRVVLGNNVVIGDRVILHPGVVIGNDSVVDDDSLLYSSVSVRENVRIGKRVIIHCGVVIGSDGFGFTPDGERYYKIPQMGGVRIEDDVEIGANTTIDRGTLGNTVIGKGTKIDNLVQIAHNVEIGKDCIIVSQAGVSGSTVVGDHVTLAGQVGVAGHLKIGDHVMVGGQSGVTKDVPSGRIISGMPAIPHRNWLKAATSFEHLPSIRKAIKRIQVQVERLERHLSGGKENDGNR
jgi:UDP-3-O-[3-hydroxymyristoyl] glucosamine N-acyltransferase